MGGGGGLVGCYVMAQVLLIKNIHNILVTARKFASFLHLLWNVWGGVVLWMRHIDSE